MNKEQLQLILDQHARWLQDNTTGARADLIGADLIGADLRGADLIGANLRRATLRGADLRGANLTMADLCRANLEGADLREANLTDANLIGANLSWADLEGADLYGANLYGADLKNSNLPKFSIVPEIGQFYGFKKLREGVVATLLISKTAKRTSSLVGRKCRASRVKVVALSEGKEAFDLHTGNIKYEVGKWIVPDKYDDDIRIECTNGIHFFITKKEAEEYN